MKRHSWLIFMLVCAVPVLAIATEQPPHAKERSVLVAGESEQMVWEPVFQGEVLIYQAGQHHRSTVVLIHGVGDNGLRDFEMVIPVLAEDYHVLAFDLPGFGHSSKQNILYSPALYAAFVKWAVDRYAHSRFAVIGHSFGGAVALRFAATFPRGLDRLILVDAAGVLHEIALSEYMVETKVEPMIAPVLGGRHKELLRVLTGLIIDNTEKLPIELDMAFGSKTTRGTMLMGNPGAIASLALVNENYTRLISEVETPTLIIWGANDQTTPLRTGKILEARMPNARLEMIPDAGHVPMREQPAAFNRRVLAELANPPRPKRIDVLVSNPPTSERIGRCSGESDIAFVGSYDRIEIEDCTRVRLLDVVARSLVIIDSDVEMEGSRIAGDELGVKVYTSFLKATACDFSGEVAIETSRSRLDFAGVALEGRDAAIASPDSSTLIASVTTVSSPHSGTSLHDYYVITPEHPL